MKLRKLVSLLAVLACVAAFCAPAYAAVVDLPVPPPTVNGDTQQGWATDGVDDVASSLTADDFHAAKYLVLELGAAPTGGLQFIWQGDGDGWAWTQTDGVVGNDGTDQTTIVIELATTAKNYDKFLASEQIKIFLGYYSPDIAGLKIEKAYFTDTAPAVGGGGDAPANPDTGDSSVVFIALMALAAAGIGVFAFARKAKSEK